MALFLRSGKGRYSGDYSREAQWGGIWAALSSEVSVDKDCEGPNWQKLKVSMAGVRLLRSLTVVAKAAAACLLFSSLLRGGHSQGNLPWCQDL